MSSPFGPLVLIANPASGRGRVGRHLREIERLLADEGLEHRVVLTRGPGHATDAAREALEDGVRFIVAAGGDGTVHEVVNGMFVEGRPVAPEAVLGVVAAGSGCDFVRTFGLPGDAVRAARHLRGEATRSVDVGAITYSGPDGHERTRHFPNVAEVGLGAAVCSRVRTLPRRLGPAQYFVGFWLVLPGFEPTTVRVDAGGERYEGRGVNVVVANCRYFGGGMRISPASSFDDGILDVLVLHGPKTDSFTIIPKVYRGRHLPHPRIVQMRGREVRVAADRPLPVEADGEPLGTTPATFTVIPGALRLKV
jgi:YegS/Rv2252/BmrU family lipid kinase